MYRNSLRRMAELKSASLKIIYGYFCHSFIRTYDLDAQHNRLAEAILIVGLDERKNKLNYPIIIISLWPV